MSDRKEKNEPLLNNEEDVSCIIIQDSSSSNNIAESVEKNKIITSSKASSKSSDGHVILNVSAGAGTNAVSKSGNAKTSASNTIISGGSSSNTKSTLSSPATTPQSPATPSYPSRGYNDPLNDRARTAHSPYDVVYNPPQQQDIELRPITSRINREVIESGGILIAGRPGWKELGRNVLRYMCFCRWPSWMRIGEETQYQRFSDESNPSTRRRGSDFLDRSNEQLNVTPYYQPPQGETNLSNLDHNYIPSRGIQATNEVQAGVISTSANSNQRMGATSPNAPPPIAPSSPGTSSNLQPDQFVQREQGGTIVRMLETDATTDTREARQLFSDDQVKTNERYSQIQSELDNMDKNRNYFAADSDDDDGIVAEAAEVSDEDGHARDGDGHDADRQTRDDRQNLAISAGNIAISIQDHDDLGKNDNTVEDNSTIIPE